MTSLSTSVSRPQVLVCTLIRSETLIEPIPQILDQERYSVVQTRDADAFFAVVDQDRFLIDCLVLEQQPNLGAIIHYLHQEAVVLPLVIVTDAAIHPALGSDGTGQVSAALTAKVDQSLYHTAEVWLPQTELLLLPQTVDRAIAHFLKLAPQSRLPHQRDAIDLHSLSSFGETLAAQQERLAEKLKERLGYIGVYYKRDPQLFFRKFSEKERERFLGELRADYRDIILDYFRKDGTVNQKIDAFVHKVFFADMSVSQVLEIHMELMDRLAKKLKLEGRSEDVLLDYRLTLIDTIAHLCEMYRRSIPRKP